MFPTGNSALGPAKRMKYAAIGMCVIIIFLAWLQDWLPKKNQEFWNRGRECEKGFTLIRQKCTDIDECVESPGLCRKNAHCTNTLGTYKCGCKLGYEATQFGCDDINECMNQDTCPENSICQNIAGNYTCQCNTGYQGHFCKDEDECSETTLCHPNATCSNTVGSYMCSCNSGHWGDGTTCSKGQC